MQGTLKLEPKRSFVHYKTYSWEFKKSFIDLYKDIGLSMACTLKKVSLDTGSYWVKKFKQLGYEGLRDGRSNNGRIPNSEFDEYILGKFKQLRDQRVELQKLRNSP